MTTDQKKIEDDGVDRRDVNADDIRHRINGPDGFQHPDAVREAIELVNATNCSYGGKLLAAQVYCDERDRPPYSEAAARRKALGCLGIK